jgi:hypothetical protein
MKRATKFWLKFLGSAVAAFATAYLLLHQLLLIINTIK